MGESRGDDISPEAQDRLIEHLVGLQQEYQQLQAWLKQTQLRLSRREAEVTRHLRAAVALLGDPQSRTTHRSHAPSNPSSALYVRTLGKFEVRYKHRAVALGNNKNGRAIFRYLVTLADRRAAKDVLLDLFWPDESPDKASHKLHIAVSTLRQALNESLQRSPGDGESVLFAEERYMLHPDLDVQLDIDALDAHVRAAERLEDEGRMAEAIVEYEAARTRYRGDFLMEDLYADWTVAQRARLEEAYLTLLGRLARHYLDQERHAEGVSCCRQILARDSFREDAYRHLMRCYSRMGRRNQALREYRNCQEVLQRELGVAPMRETVTLYEQIVREEAV